MSIEFAAELEPEPRLRSCVLLAAALAAAIGVLFVVMMTVGGWTRGALLLAWGLSCRRDIRHQLRGYARVCSLRLDAAGLIRATGPSGVPVALELVSGSVVLQRAAWLRLKFADGSVYGELLTGDSMQCPHWHALQLLWEQQRRAFGRAR